MFFFSIFCQNVQTAYNHMQWYNLLAAVDQRHYNSFINLLLGPRDDLTVFITINVQWYFLYLQSLRRMEVSAALAFFTLAISLLWNFLLCYTATELSDVVASISDIIYSGNWFEYPMVYRKYVRLMTLRSQRPVYFMGLGIIHCNMETFTNASYWIFL